MRDHENKEIIIRPTVPNSNLEEFLSKLNNIKILYIDPNFISGKNFKTIFESEDADLIICTKYEDLNKSRSSDKVIGYFKKVSNNNDIEEIINASAAGARFIVVDTYDWKIIPLENIIARLHKSETKIYATAKNAEEVIRMFAVLELGVDGVILSTNNEKEIDEILGYLHNTIISLKPAKILEVKDVGIGERVCVDTASILEIGEGMLIGSKSNFMFLIHNESVGSSFTSPRPFRVNAGAVYCYTMLPDGKTSYLSEIESGNEVLIVNKDGFSRTAAVGRSKIETRPLRLIKAELDGEIGTVILQNAETITLIRQDGQLTPVTNVRVDDFVLCYAKAPSGRHFGIEVKERILEK